jgi:hypothetical protein
LELVAEAFLELGQFWVGLILQKVHLQADDGAALAMQFQPWVIHAVLVEVRQNLIRTQGPRRGEQNLIEMRREADARRIIHRVHGAALAVGEGLHAAQVEESGCGWPATCESGGGDGSVGGDIHLLDVGMHGRSGVRGVEERLAQRVGDGGSGEALIEEHGPVGNGGVELGEGGMAMLGPLIRMPAAHGGDPLAVGSFTAASGESLLDFPDGGRVFEDGVIAGAVREAHAMDMRLDESGHGGPTAEVDGADARTCGRSSIDGNDAAVANRDTIGDGVRCVHRVDTAIGEENGFLWCLSGQYFGGERARGSYSDEVTTRKIRHVRNYNARMKTAPVRQWGRLASRKFKTFPPMILAMASSE